MGLHYSDWNGSKRGHVYKFLRSQGFESSYDIAHQYTDADEHKVNIFYLLFYIIDTRICHLFLLIQLVLLFMQWVSHRNHRGNICGVDFIWLLNPNKYRKLLKASWSEAVFGFFKVHKDYHFLFLQPFNPSLWKGYNLYGYATMYSSCLAGEFADLVR